MHIQAFQSQKVTYDSRFCTCENGDRRRVVVDDPSSLDSLQVEDASVGTDFAQEDVMNSSGMNLDNISGIKCDFSLDILALCHFSFFTARFFSLIDSK